MKKKPLTATPKLSLVAVVKAAMNNKPKYTKTALARLPVELADELADVLTRFDNGEFGPEYPQTQLIRDVNDSGQLPLKLTKSMLRLIRIYLSEKSTDG